MLIPNVLTESKILFVVKVIAFWNHNLYRIEIF